MSTLAHTVERTIVLPAGPDEVWDAITDESLLGEWLADHVELDPREGGEVRCSYEDGEERRGEVELVEEAERLAFHWHREGAGPSRVEFIVDAVAEGTRLRVVEAALSPAAGPTMLAGGWATRLSSLRLLLGRLVLA